jgi:hypothetical protein
VIVVHVGRKVPGLAGSLLGCALVLIASIPQLPGPPYSPDRFFDP